MRWLLIWLLLPLAGVAQKLTANDVNRIKLFCTGSFSTPVADTSQLQLLITKAIWPKRKDGVWIYAEQKAVATVRKQQVWHFYIADDSTLVWQFFDFKEPEKFSGLHQNLQLENSLKVFHLLGKSGCELYLRKKDKNTFAGATDGKECYSLQEGVAYCFSEAFITAAQLQILEKSFNKDAQEIAATNLQFFKKNKSVK
ncbi:MAG: hypothetical protein RLZZ316_2988 [Bacteroidota bacterium]